MKKQDNAPAELRNIPEAAATSLQLRAQIDSLTRALRESEAERERLGEDLTIARTTVDDINRAKDLFLAALSHELRTPLSSLLLQAQRLRRGPIDEAGLRRASEMIERAARAQAQLIDDLLDMSRIVSGNLKMAPRAVSLSSICEAALEGLTPLLERKRLQLDRQLDATLRPVWGDPVRLQQVVQNLLTNAIKFTPDGGCITVALDAVDERARIRVIDRGIGIEPSLLPQIFERFSQANRQERPRSGLGLGLAIVRYLVEAHGGTVRAESAGKGQGATFTVWLPLFEPAVQ